MKKHMFLFPFSILLLAACEKVVDIDLNTATQQYVIEGTLFEGMDTVKVHVAKTTDYYGRAPQEHLNDATVTLSDNAGNTASIPLVADGRYELPGFNAIAGRLYHLRVIVDGKEFTASSAMPQPVKIDSLSKEFKEDDFRDEGFEVAACFTDPSDQQNYYRLVYTINDTLQNEPDDLYLLNDKFNNGKPVKSILFRRRFEKGDKIACELRTMDEQVYDFFTTLSELLDNQNGPAPANPNTNIRGGALGYFGAFTSSKKQIVID